ncbi:MAG: 4Fe-4S binding protein [Bacteroidota bacterium]
MKVLFALIFDYLTFSKLGIIYTLLLIEIIPNKCDFCGCCVGICPEDAIELKEAEIKIIESRCTNCVKCVWSCPLEVLKFNKEGLILEN